MRRLSLPQRVTLFATLAFGAVWAVAVGLMTLTMWSEQDELFDQQLVEYAHVLLPLLTQSEAEAAEASRISRPDTGVGMDEAVLYRLIGPEGQILRQSARADEANLPAPGSLIGQAFNDEKGYRIYVTRPNEAGYTLEIAAPLTERREALREGLTGFLLPMIALLPLTWLMVGWATRRALAPMMALRAEIVARDGNRLDMIDTLNWPHDQVRIAGSLNRFMARLSQALDAERTFATNAAHELRTPISIALAQVQQLRQESLSETQTARIDATERALQRMKRLVARLLQLARSDAGIGASEVAHDLVPLTRLVLEDVVPRAAAARIEVELPDRPVSARIDPDAFAIVLGNLVENALQHSPADSTISLYLSPDAVLEIANECQVIPQEERTALARRHHRRDSEGFGLGLHICEKIVAGAGGVLELISPRPNHIDGFLARLTLPL